MNKFGRKVPNEIDLNKYLMENLIYILQCGLFCKLDISALLWKVNTPKYFREFLNFAVMFSYKLFGVTDLNFLLVG